MALSYAVGARGADHLRSGVYSLEMRGMSDRYAVAGKGALVNSLGGNLAIIYSMIICGFAKEIYEWEYFSRLYTHATGLKMRVEYLKKAAQRIVDQARLFSTKEGISRKDDALPGLFHEQSFSEGPSKAHAVVKDDLVTMIDE